MKIFKKLFLLLAIVFSFSLFALQSIATYAEETIPVTELEEIIEDEQDAEQYKEITKLDYVV